MEAEINVKKDERTRAWIHFIDTGNYSIASFLKESEIFGASARVQLSVLKNMRWGDKICSFSSMRTLESGWFFATWPITKIIGLSGAVSRAIVANHPSSAIDFGGRSVTRGSGCYSVGISYRAEGWISEISETLDLFQAAGGNIGDLMIACGPGVLSRLKKPFPVFPDLSEETGILSFDFDGAMGALEKMPGSKRMEATGRFRMDELCDPGVIWDGNPVPIVPEENFANMESFLGGGIIETHLKVVVSETRRRK